MAAKPFDRRIIPSGFRFRRFAGADGWMLRGFDWPAAGAPPRGSILFQSGRADFIEKYLEALAWWHERGWSVSGFDWRGQGGSGAVPAGADAKPCGPTLDAMLADVAAEAGRWMAGTSGPHVVIGHSMGGHLLLRLLAEHRVAVTAAVLAAPMLGLAHAPLSPAAARRIAIAACAVGLGGKAPWTRAADDGRQARLTACPDRYADEEWWRRANPALRIGPVTWGWLAEAFASIARLDAPGVLEAVGTPVLLLATARDRLVSAAAVRVAARRLPDARLTMLDGAHELLREADPVRSAAFAAIDVFLDEKAPVA